MNRTLSKSRRCVRRARAKCCVEEMERRLLLSAVNWSSTSGGSWSTAGDWSTGKVPQPGDTVTIDQPGNIQITLSGSVSVGSISVTGDTLLVSGGTLALASSSTVGAGATLNLTNSSLVTLAAGTTLINSGTITVNPGSQLDDFGALSQLGGSTLNLPNGSPGTGVGTDVLTNGGFESPSADGSTTTAPGTWGVWGSTYVSTQYAHSGAQSIVTSGPNSGVEESFNATPGVSYTASVYAMTPTGLTGPEGAFLIITFANSSGTMISTYSAPYDVNILSSTSASGGPITGSVGSIGWNYYTTTAVAPAGSATVALDLDTGAYTGNSGTAGGSIYYDDADFGPTATNSGSVTAASITNNGTIKIGAGDNVTATGAFTQTSAGTLQSLLGGPPAGNLFGTLTVGGTATLAGTLSATVTNGYSPSLNDGFSVASYAAESGAFNSYQLPSGSGYVFQPAVNPTYLGISAVPTALSTTVNTSSTLSSSTDNVIGVNLAYWDDQLTTTQTQQMVEAAGLNLFRFPGGSASDDYHFNVAANYGDPAANTIPQFAQFISAVGGTGIVTTDYGSGSPQEAEAELAYLEGSPSDTSTVIGNGIEWNDTTGQWQTVNWQTVGYWASLRAASPLKTDDGFNFLRIDHPAAFTDIKYWEIGNEEYGSWEVDHHGTNLPSGTSTGAQHDPETYAQFAEAFESFDLNDTALPVVSVGIDSEDPTGADDNDWTKNVLTKGAAIGFVPGFISDHSYMQAPGSESDSFLLNDTVSDSSSLDDWSVRHADYESLLAQTLGTRASGVQVMATEFNSVYSNPGKQSTSLVNGLFIADSIGSLLDSGYSAGVVWDLRNGWDTGENNSSSLYGWREGGDYGLLGDPNDNDPPSTGPYVPYPNYFAEQLASKIAQSGGTVVSATSSYSEISAYAVLEPDGHLDLMVINKNPDASLTEQFALNGFTPGGGAEVWQYGEVQDDAQSQSTTGSSALANFNTTLSLSGSNFSYSFPAYSMTVIDISPALVVTQAAAANPNPATGNSTNLTVSATEGSSGAGLLYSWSTTSMPNGANAPTFSVNGTNAASNTVATIYAAGTYGFMVTITDPFNESKTSSTSVVFSLPNDTWTGTQSDLWTNPFNWSQSATPGDSTTVTITGGTAVANTNITIGGLNITGGSLDLTNNSLTIDYGSGADPIGAIQSYVTSGYAGGAWNGPGIISSAVAAANSSGGAYGVGFADSADGVDGNLSSGQIEVMPALLGDATLAGAVTFGDFQLLAQYFGSAGGWDEGNWTYGATIDFGDFQVLAQNFGKTASLAAAEPAAKVGESNTLFSDTPITASDGGGATDWLGSDDGPVS
jgi:alpha-L-arabinofuranosidase